jgi:hypothetical protein
VRLTRHAALACVLTSAACGPSAEQRAARAADVIVARADSAGRVFRGTVGGRPLALMVDGCAVYDLADAPRGDEGARDARLTPDFYPWPTVCSREAITADTAWVTVVLGRTGFGAGGCCATGGTYRTRDGRRWEREDGHGRWVAADAARPNVEGADSAPAAP